MAKLSAKHARFVEEYLIDLNGAQAAIRSGYSPAAAKEIASRLLTNANVKAALDKAMANRSKRTGINQDRVLQELAKIGFADMSKFVEWGPNGMTLKNSAELSPEDTACVSEVSESKGKTTKRSIKLHDKKGCLELLGRHLGMFKDDEANADKDLTINIVYGTPPPEGPADG